jgi:hypothetical protein
MILFLYFIFFCLFCYPFFSTQQQFREIDEPRRFPSERSDQGDDEIEESLKLIGFRDRDHLDRGRV